MTDQEQAFWDACEVFDPTMSYEEYVVCVFRSLMLSDWHEYHSPEGATACIRSNVDYIRESYAEKNPVNGTMVEIGYTCG